MKVSAAIKPLRDLLFICLLLSVLSLLFTYHIIGRTFLVLNEARSYQSTICGKETGENGEQGEASGQIAMGPISQPCGTPSSIIAAKRLQQRREGRRDLEGVDLENYYLQDNNYNDNNDKKKRYNTGKKLTSEDNKDFSNRQVIAEGAEKDSRPIQSIGTRYNPANEELSSDNRLIQGEYGQGQCTNDEASLPLLKNFQAEPRLSFLPPFNSSSTFEYFSTVPYHILLIRIWAFAAHCRCEARMHNKTITFRATVHALGLGQNKFVIYVVDISHSEQWVLGAYTLSVYRQHQSFKRPQDEFALLHQKHQVCEFLQDCGLPYYPQLPCDFQLVQSQRFWNDYHEQERSLPTCLSGDAPGRWLVPCFNCSLSSTCDINSMTWQPYQCSHRKITRLKLRKCLAGHKVLFIGDSTIRGIMHYMMEEINNSLTDWDKTHDLKSYSNLNMNRTRVSFVYYPQFWLPRNERPEFHETFQKLLESVKHLDNSATTMIVVGGVHWLATHHLDIISTTLQRRNLSNVKVVMKSLGAGFHQPVDGLHLLSLPEQQKLVVHNNALLEHARRLSFSVVDTFNMTMSRYKDFMQGDCACHFHKIREILPSFVHFLRDGASATSDRETSPEGAGETGDAVDMPTTKMADLAISYHVEGHINAAYSKILLGQICNSM